MLKIYNSLSKETEEFKPIDEGIVKMYSCGPTVYNYPHIGNFRAFLFSDLLRRTLMFLGYDVIHIMNITDVDDKTIKNSQLAGKSLKEFTEFFTKEFNRELDDLNILPASKQTLATEHIADMVKMVEKLIEKEFAYKGEDGSIYFSISKLDNYGQLTDLQVGNQVSRIINDEYDKDNVQDFALWKAWTQDDGDVFWETSLGKGRPGWHIECSAMATKYLGNHFDIHTGGVDLKVPHHENEIAQSTCCSGKKYVNFWLHNEHLLISGEKMAKSKGNQFNLSDLVEKGYSPLDYRYFVLSANYRTQINMTWESLDAARNARLKLSKFVRDIEETGHINREFSDRFKEDLEDDLNTPKALATVWELTKSLTVPDADKKATLLYLDDVLGLKLSEVGEIDELPEDVLKIIAERDKAREEKDFDNSDKLRSELEGLGYEVSDTPDGTQVKKEIR